MKRQSDSEILLYQTDYGTTRDEVRMAGDTVWLNQNQMADLFLTTKQNVGQHIRNVFAEGELAPESVVKDFFTTAANGKQYCTKHYSLDVITHVPTTFPLAPEPVKIAALNAYRDVERGLIK
ncbi:MAG: hypothetical protein Q8O38_02690 [Sulfurimicrobium sp.]|nr:hypothetical protein [Sulfurimicrobium sp.]